MCFVFMLYVALNMSIRLQANIMTNFQPASISNIANVDIYGLCSTVIFTRFHVCNTFEFCYLVQMVIVPSVYVNFYTLEEGIFVLNDI